MNTSLIVAESRTFEGRPFPIYRAADGTLLFDPRDVAETLGYKSPISQMIRILRKGEDYVVLTGKALKALKDEMNSTLALEASVNSTLASDRMLFLKYSTHFRMLTSDGVTRVCLHVRTPKAKAFREALIDKLGEQIKESAIPTNELPEVTAMAETQIIRAEPVVGTVETEHDTTKKAMTHSAIQVAINPTPAQCRAFAAISREHRLCEKERQQRNDVLAEEMDRLRDTLPGLTDEQRYKLNLAESRARCQIAIEQLGYDPFEQALQTETSAPVEPVREPVREPVQVGLTPTEIAERWAHADGTPVSHIEVGHVITSIYGLRDQQKDDDAEGIYSYLGLTENGRRVRLWQYAQPALGKIETEMLATGHIRRNSIVPA
jgi:prophage antirepressor-like protein